MGKNEGKVIIDIEIYWTTIAATVRYASVRIPEPDWREFYGLLLGHPEKNKLDVHITQAVPMTHTKNIGHILKVQFEEEDYVAGVGIEDEAIAERGDYIMGWVHSHPGIKVMFSLDDIKTQLGWQEKNDLAIGIVFNQKRLLNQAEMPAKKGDPLTLLQNDPGFEIYRLDDPARGTQASYHKVQYEFNSPLPLPQIIQQGKIFVEEVTQFFPRDNPDKRVAEDVQKSIEMVNSAVVGLEEYCKTLIRKGDAARIKEVVAAQRAEIDEIIRTRNERIEKQRQLFNYVEFKERDTIIPNVQQTFKFWEDAIVAVKPRIDALVGLHIA